MPGLSRTEAARRLQTQGRNELRRAPPTPWWRVLMGQFHGAMVWLLLGACLVSAVLGEVGDAVAIASIVLLNALVGFRQESDAERAVLALRAMTAPRARVLRDGHSVLLPAAEVVQGDVLVLEAGDLVAADATLLEAHALTTLEAALTGESTPVDKRVGPVPPGTPLAERLGAIFLGTAIATGTARAEVTTTGMATELGKIAHLLEGVDDTTTPLQQRLESVGGVLLKLCLAIVALVAILGLARGEPWLQVLMIAVSLAVAAVPEGLAAMVTIALAIGVQRMAARRVLVRHLPAVETLGSTTVICTDKTGTLTTGVMTVRHMWGPDHTKVLDAAVACCDAELDATGLAGAGDPTEVAILVAAAERGILREAIERDRPRRAETPFDSDRKRMAILRADGRWYVKGALEKLLPLCSQGQEGATAAQGEMAAAGLRVLAVAVGQGDQEADLTLLGLLGLADPPRTEAIEAVRQAHAAGIRTVMITGDHPVTAQAIAREMGILRPGDDPAEVVHARATAEDKLRIVRTWKQRGAIVAMTGDGVNDAPALKEAHIGIAMGRSGTEVTREAADMVLTDDDFASIVAAVQEGRGIFDNIRKALVYLLSGNSAELLIMLGASLAGWPVPLLPLHLLWINLVTDGLPALALVMDPAGADTLQRPPRKPEEPMLRAREWRTIAATGALEATVVLSVFAWELDVRGPQGARSLAFSTLVFSEVLRSFSARSPTRLFWEVGPFSNVRLLAVVLGTLFAQVAIHDIPWSQRLFDLRMLTGPDFMLALGCGLLPVSVLELAKLVRRLVRPSRGRPGSIRPGPTAG
jgi:Ca2+-transporting ATPase